MSFVLDASDLASSKPLRIRCGGIIEYLVKGTEEVHDIKLGTREPLDVACFEEKRRPGSVLVRYATLTEGFGMLLGAPKLIQLGCNRFL